MLKVTRSVVNEMIKHARADYPKEACGVLAGAGDITDRVFRMTNADHSPVSYTMDPMEQLQLEKRLRAEQLQLRAIYHSHTASEAYPSPTDVRLAVYSDVAYVLVSLQNLEQPIVNSYRIQQERITDDPLDICEG